MALAPPAYAAETGTTFAFSALRPDQAVLAIGLKAGLTLGFTTTCHGPLVALEGSYPARAALDRALSRTDCRAVWIDATTVRIERRPAAPRPLPPMKLKAAPIVASAQEVVVTASKRDLDSLGLPGSVSVSDASALSSVHARETSDLRLLASGLTVTNLGPGRDKVLLRGLSDGAFTGRTQSTVGLYWNGAPTTYNAPDPDLKLVDVAAVEVLRGPQGTLYGAGALGGVINVVPNAPDPRRLNGYASTTASSTAFGGPSAGAELMLNQPLAGGGAALRVVAYGEAEGGWIDLPRLGVQNANHVSEAGLRASLLWHPTPGWNLTLSNIYQDIYSRDTQYTTGAVDALSRDTQVREPHDNDFEQASADLRGQGAWGELRSLTSFNYHEFSSRYDASLALPDFGAGAGPASYDDDTLIRQASQEFDYRAPWRGPATLLLGAYGGFGDEQERTGLKPLAGPTLYSEARTDHLLDLALFGEGSYALTRRLTLTAGLRWSFADRRTRSQVTQGDARALFDGERITHEASPKLALDYRVASGLQTYALVSRGYRIGGFNTAGPVGATAFTGAQGAEPNRVYSPDSLLNYELGLKIQGFQHRLEARTAVYYDVWRHLEADQLLPSGLPYVANVGTAHVAGWEGDVSTHLTAQLTFAFGALFTAPDLSKVDASFPAGRSDFTLPGVARRSLDGRIAYLLPLGSDRTLEFSASAYYVAHSYLFFGPQGSAESGDYLDGRLQAIISASRWKLSLLVTNPANNRGNTFAFGDPFSLPAGPQSTPLRPRTISLRVERSF